MSRSQDNDEVIEFIKLPPDAGLVKSLGANHSLESALADLVDNSVDAEATRVSIRLLTRNDRLVQVEVVDNGFGMDDEVINKAMTVGHQRAYKDGDLGHFGMGLNAASFGCSDVLTVWSSTNRTTPVGRRIRRSDFTKSFTCEVLSARKASAVSLERQKIIGTVEGTTVVWTALRNTYRGRSAEEACSWLDAREAALRAHLGVTFHKLLEDKRLEIDIMIDEIDSASNDPGVPVLPINPFGYARSGHPDYPKALIARAGRRKVKLTCHVWPPKSDVTGFRIGNKPGENFQGFYIYRNERLLKIGGWAEIATPRTNRQLARVEIADVSAIGKFLVMNSEKTGPRFEPTFHDAVSHAIASDGTTFVDYIEDAEFVYATSKKRTRRRRPVIKPEKGFAPAIRRRAGSELEFISETLTVQWERLHPDEFFKVDLPGKKLSLNQRYRALFVPYRGGGNDAPFLKALMFLLTHHIFEGQLLGAKDKDDIALWNSILAAALNAEKQMRDK